MNKTIHILNGDSMAQILEKSGIKGDVVVWRELLCEGPLHMAIGSNEFWTKRYTFFEEEFGDLQYFLYLKKLEKYYNIKEEKYYLNENGCSKVN